MAKKINKERPWYQVHHEASPGLNRLVLQEHPWFVGLYFVPHSCSKQLTFPALGAPPKVAESCNWRTASEEGNRGLMIQKQFDSSALLAVGRLSL